MIESLEKDLLEKLRNAIIETGRMIEEDFLSRNFTTETKADGSPVTSTDLKSQDFLIPRIQELFPTAKIISEESNSGEYPKDDLVITIDPLAGTRNFLKSVARFNIMISIIRNGTVIFGTTYNPITNIFDEVENATTENSGMLRTIEKEGVSYNNPIRTVSRKDLKRGYRPIINMLNGEIDFVVYPNDAIYIWDIAPLHGILKSHGGNIYKLDGTEYTYNSISNSGSIVAIADPSKVSEVLRIIKG